MVATLIRALVMLSPTAALLAQRSGASLQDKIRLITELKEETINLEVKTETRMMNGRIETMWEQTVLSIRAITKGSSISTILLTE